VKTSQFDAKPDEVDHWTPSSHWCAGCWHWVVDCKHLRDPLPLEHDAVDDGWIQSLAYDRVTQCLEVRFKWHSVHQYRPVPLQIVTKSGNGRRWSPVPAAVAARERSVEPRSLVPERTIPLSY
jgi:hypothetical protein